MSHFNVKTPRFYPLKNLEICKRYDLGSEGTLSTDSGDYNMQTDFAKSFADFNPWKPKIVNTNILQTPVKKVCMIYASGQHTSVTYQPSTLNSIGLNYFCIMGHNFDNAKAKFRLLAVNKDVEEDADYEEYELECTPLFNCCIEPDTDGKNWIKGVRYQEEDPDDIILANGSLMVEIEPDVITQGYGRYIKIEIVPMEDTFDENLEIGSYGWGRYFDMPHTPDLNYTIGFEYDNVQTQRTIGGSDIINVKYTQKPSFCGKYEGFGREESKVANINRRTWNLKFSSLKSEYENNYDDVNGALFPKTHYSNTEWRYGNNFLSRVLEVTMGGQLPFIFEEDNQVLSDENNVTFWGTGEHNEAHFYIAKFRDNNFEFDHTSHKMFNANMNIVESF